MPRTKNKGIETPINTKFFDSHDSSDAPDALSSPDTNRVSNTTYHLGSMIRERRLELDLAQADVARLLNVTRNSITNWEAGKCNPDYTMIPGICAFLDINPNEFYGLHYDNPPTALELRVLKNLRTLSPSNQRVIDKMVQTMADEMAAINAELSSQTSAAVSDSISSDSDSSYSISSDSSPTAFHISTQSAKSSQRTLSSAFTEQEADTTDMRLKIVYGLFLVRPGMAAAGVGDYVPDEAPTYTFLRKNTINAKADGIVKVDGDSMEPVYHNGDYVYYKEAYTACPGEDVIVDTDEGAVIKRMASDRTLYSVNPDLPYPMKHEDNELIIRGVVLGTVHSSDRASNDEIPVLEELFTDEIKEFLKER